jgi:mannose-6-phosphate isomerase-like protein (cupin superfamily)
MRRIHVGEARADPDGVAPDGIPIHLVLCDFHTAGQEAAMGSMRFVGLAEGRIPPGEWGVHAHCSLEQITYVLEGEVVVRMRDLFGSEVHTVTLQPGQALATLPAQTLSFANAGESAARVLFICAPPYPPDHRDTLVLHPGEGPGGPALVACGENLADRPIGTPAPPEERHRALTAEELERVIAQQERMREQVTQVFDERIATLRALLTRPRSAP